MCDFPISMGILGDFSVWSKMILECIFLIFSHHMNHVFEGGGIKLTCFSWTKSNCLFWMCFYIVTYLLRSEPPIQWQSSWFQRWRRERRQERRRAVPTHWKKQGRLVLVGRCHSRRWIGRIANARQYGGFAWWLLRCWPSSLLAYPCRPSMTAHQNTCQNMSKHL